MIRKASLFLSCFKLCLASAAIGQPGHANYTGFKFSVPFYHSVHPADITGRVYVMISRNNSREPRFQIGESGVPFWGMNVNHLTPGEGALISDIPAGEYYVQGFVNMHTEFLRSNGYTLWLHNDQWEGQDWRRGEGNLYSEVRKVHIDPAKAETIELVCAKANPAVKIPEDKNAYYLDNEWTRVDRPDTRRPDGNVRSTMSGENLFELVVEQWKKYDLHAYLQANWPSIGKDLKETRDPYFDGVIDFGRKKPHGYGPRGAELVKLMMQQVNKNRENK